MFNLEMTSPDELRAKPRSSGLEVVVWFGGPGTK